MEKILVYSKMKYIHVIYRDTHSYCINTIVFRGVFLYYELSKYVFELIVFLYIMNSL